MARRVPDLIGRTIGEYEITSLIGAGAMGAVYEGRHPLIGKRVAVKVLLGQRDGDESQVQRFVAEARAVNEIRHRGIVDIFGFGLVEENGAHYFVMELLEGLAFNAYVKKHCPLHPVEALFWTEELCDALAAAHGAGIIHRDVKPANLFLVDAGRGQPYLKVLDFGVAKLLTTLEGDDVVRTQTGAVIGTPAYISPEQATGLPISPKTDLYAVGCVLFELLTGRRPFIGESPLRTMAMHVSAAPQPPSDFAPGLPAALDALVLQALAKAPGQRPASADELRVRCIELRRGLERTSGQVPIAIAPQRAWVPPAGPAPQAASAPAAAVQRPVPGPPPAELAWPTAPVTLPGSSGGVSSASVPVPILSLLAPASPPGTGRAPEANRPPLGGTESFPATLETPAVVPGKRWDTMEDVAPVRGGSIKVSGGRRPSSSGDLGPVSGRDGRKKGGRKVRPGARRRSFRVVWLSLALLATMLGAFAYWFPQQALALLARAPLPQLVRGALGLPGAPAPAPPNTR